MEKQNENLRYRLLASLPQPENLAAYREETTSLLARYEKSLFWEKFPARVITWLGCAVFVTVNSTWGPKVGINEHIFLELLAGLLIFVGAVNELGYRISRSKVDLLKEVKQLQLQVLEVQASLRKTGE